MKLKLLAAASALAIAGVAYEVHRETRPETGAAAADTPTAVEHAASTSVPDHTPAGSQRTATAPTASSEARTEAPTVPALPAATTDGTARGGAPTSRAQPPAGGAPASRRSVTSIKLRRSDPALDEPKSAEATRARQERMNRTIESAACHAPDLEQRYRRLPETERAALRTKCAKYGVTLTDPT